MEIGNWKLEIELQYVKDINGKTEAAQITLTEWDRVVNKLKKNEQALKLHSDLQEAFEQVSLLKKQKGDKRTLNDFVNEL